jgi:hypothetical protein
MLNLRYSCLFAKSGVQHILCCVALETLYTYIDGKYEINLHSLRDRSEQLTKCLFFLSVILLVQIKCIFFDSVRIYCICNDIV